MAGLSNSPKQLFSDVHFFITSSCSEALFVLKLGASGIKGAPPPSQSFFACYGTASEAIALIQNLKKVKQQLKQGGARREFYISDLVTHVITDSADFPQHSEAEEFNLPIVLIPSGDLNILWAMVTYHGGSVQLSLTSDCTHLVIPKPIGEKYKCALKYPGLIKIVTPSWLIDSIRKDKLLPEEDYMPAEPPAPSPSVTAKNMEINQSPAATTDVNTQGSSANENIQCKTSPHDTIPPPTTVDVGMTSLETKPPVVTKLVTSTAEIATSLASTQANSTPAFTTLSNQPFTMSGAETRTPMQMPRQSEGHATAAAVIETPSNVALDSTEKKGQTEGPPCVQSNGQETESHWCVFAVSDYQDLMEHSALATWTEVIELHGGTVSPFYTPRCTHLICLHQCGKLFSLALKDGKIIVTAHWLNDVLLKGSLFPPCNPLHLPTPFEKKLPECAGMSISVTGFTGQERQLVRNMVFMIGANYTGYLMRTNTHLVCRSSESLKYKKAREWGIPCINAKWLSDIVSGGKVPPCALTRYSQYGTSDELSITSSLVEPLLEPWKDFKPDTSMDYPQKRPAEEIDENRNAKKRRLTESSTVEINSNTPHVLFTGLPQSHVYQLQRMVLNLGGKLAESPQTCTHLVTNKIVRTVKFLSAISVCQHLVTTAWLQKSREVKHFVDPSLYPLQDLASEKEYGIDIKQSLKRARERRCLQGIQVYVSPNVEPCPASMKEIIESAGGQMLTNIPSKQSLTTLKTLKTNEGHPALVVVTCPTDVAKCIDFIRCGYASLITFLEEARGCSFDQEKHIHISRLLPYLAGFSGL
ncbi:predicted protein [Nematostella vectensis]|uniref:PAX-interacting protein 1 n=1 Tax=Nematostella vectensis TaxID=45351 RepID=A7S5M3_NEMVE|nr:predicted protein [Nematostella vectensis]|eukprot:XP_001633097.1 predicted protein [Nematostella vectensis]